MARFRSEIEHDGRRLRAPRAATSTAFAKVVATPNRELDTLAGATAQMKRRKRNRHFDDPLLVTIGTVVDGAVHVGRDARLARPAEIERAALHGTRVRQRR